MALEKTKLIDGLSLLCRTGQQLSSIHDLDELLEKIMEVTKEVCDAEASSILLMDEENQELYFKVALGEKGEKVKRIRFSVKEGIAGYVARERKNLIVNDVKNDPRHLKRADEISAFETKSIACVPIIWENNLIGVIQALNKRTKGFNNDDLNYLGILASQAAVAIDNSQNLEKLQNFFVHMIEIIVMAIESITDTPEGHCMNVGRIATSIARRLEISGKTYENIYYAALIHDIGKLKISELSIKGDQFHPILGAEMIKSITLLEKVAPIIEVHHECIDGSGYPKGIKEFSQEGKILALAESYEMWNYEMKQKQIQNHSIYDFVSQKANCFDPVVLQALIKALEEE
ncbi:MAG: GAF domain-containing protein [Armatimonadetes bacterium]|nr:GAF domain-containing protein [Armatimonadota bacterium]